MKGITYLLFRFWLFILFVLFTSPVLLVAIALRDYCSSHEQYRKFESIFSVLGVVWLVGLAWLANRTAEHIAFEDRKFRDALNCAVYDLRLRLSFLPVIGKWLEPKNRDDDDHDA